MKKKTFKRQRARCLRLVAPWIEALGLALWDGEFIYYRDAEKYHADNPDASPGGVAMAWVQWQYLTYKIAVNVPMICHMDDDHLRRVLVHELCHVLTEEMKEPDEDNKHNERVVTSLQKALFWVKCAAEDGKLRIE